MSQKTWRIWSVQFSQSSGIGSTGIGLASEVAALMNARDLMKDDVMQVATDTLFSMHRYWFLVYTDEDIPFVEKHFGC